jgi:hypothetical protein
MKRKQTFNTIFLQDWGTFTNETLVCVAVTKKEILQFMKRNNFRKTLIEQFERKSAPSAGASAFVWNPTGAGCTLLWMDSWLGRREDVNTLVHETNHLIYDISRDKGFEDEPEIQAYQQEYLFKNIWAGIADRCTKFKGLKSRSKKRR